MALLAGPKSPKRRARLSPNVPDKFQLSGVSKSAADLFAAGHRAAIGPRHHQPSRIMATRRGCDRPVRIPWRFVSVLDEGHAGFLQIFDAKFVQRRALAGAVLPVFGR